jgi:hypothetical protein
MDKFDIRYKNPMNKIDDQFEKSLKTMRAIAISLAIFWMTMAVAVVGGVVYFVSTM